MAKQCKLLGLCRSSYYYRSNRDDEYIIKLMWFLDEQYIGIRRLIAWLRACGYIVNLKRVRELMRWKGLQTICTESRKIFYGVWIPNVI